MSELYNLYKQQDDFVGMDMARKFLQMGYTRAMRYAKHKGGRKYDNNHELLPETINEEKVECAQVGSIMSGQFDKPKVRFTIIYIGDAEVPRGLEGS